MAIIVTGASGAFGRAAAGQLLSRIAPSELIFTTRKPAGLADLAARGAQVRYADFDDPSSLVTAFAGGTRMLLISTSRVGSRVGQHENAVKAAAAAGVKHIVYTSILGAAVEGNPAIVKRDHYATEQIIKASGIPYTFLRDSQYAEAIAAAVVPVALASGVLPDNAQDGPVAFVSRDDCIASAVGALTTPGHENKAYDITGPELLSFRKAIAMAVEISGQPIDYQPVSDEGMMAYFDSLGVPRQASDDPGGAPMPWSSEDMVSFGRSIREGYFNVITDSVERLTGRKPRTMREVMMQFKDSWPKKN
jgi:NAD(P)H dehydrogenase (quinone)